MILDRIEQLKRYSIPHADAILNFLSRHDCAQLPDGEMEILGRELFVRIMSYTPKPAQEKQFEIHYTYADVQYMASGSELIQTARWKDLTAVGEHDKAGDYHFFKASGPVDHFIITAGDFAVFYPKEPHCPGCLYEGHKAEVKKLVFKVKIV